MNTRIFQLFDISPKAWVLYFSILCALSPGLTVSFAQVSQTHRYERKQKSSFEYFTLVSLKEEGIALFREQDKFNGNKRKWELILLDTALNERHVLELEIENRNTILGYEYIKGHLYLLYRMGDMNKNKIQLLDIDITKGEEVLRQEIKPELDFKITHFSKVGSHVVLGGYVTNDPAVLLYSLADKQIKILPGFFQKDTELVDVRVNQNETFNTLVIDRSNRAERKLMFRTFDEMGNILLETFSPIDENISLQTSITSTLEREDLIVLGTWGQRTGRQSSGFFSWSIDPFQEPKIKYLYFGELDKFLDYLKPKRVQRIKEKTRTDLQDGKRPDFTAYAVPFKIIEHPGGFLLLAEAYDPQSTNPYYANPYYNNPNFYNPTGGPNPYWPGYYPGMRMYRSPFMNGDNTKNGDEIKTFGTSVLSFDPKGKLLWDQSIKLEDARSAALEQEGDFYYTDSTVTLMYKKESELKIKKIDIESGGSMEQTEKIKLNDPVEEIRSEKDNEGGLNYWTGNTFYVWGYHTLRNVTKDERVRDVFYINKVVVH